MYSKYINELKEDQSQVVPTADNGIAVVVRDKLDYADKALSLLAVTSTYRIINKDPTTKLKTCFLNPTLIMILQKSLQITSPQKFKRFEIYPLCTHTHNQILSNSQTFHL